LPVDQQGRSYPGISQERHTMNLGDEMYQWVVDLFPINRSLTGDGVRQTLAYLNELLDGRMVYHEVPTGTRAFDWVVPKEWNIRDAWIKDASGHKIIDFQASNLHVVGYSVPVDEIISLAELQRHLFSLPDQPDAIPYITSYYEERWGFCLTERQRQGLKKGDYHVFIDSVLQDGALTYGELIIPGHSTEEIFISTNICHPSMANNELSGPVVTTALARHFLSLPEHRYTYRIIYIPETIGSLVYLSRNIELLQRNVIAGFVVTCVGDDRAFSLLHSRYGNTLADKIAENVLKHCCPDYKSYSYLDRGSDERQYGFPGVDLPMVSIMRSKYREYPEYHTSLDNLDLISPAGLLGAFDVLRESCSILESNKYYKIKGLGEPQLGKRGLYPTVSTKSSNDLVRDMMNFIVYADGTNDLVDISNIIDRPVSALWPIVERLLEADLLEEVAVG